MPKEGHKYFFSVIMACHNSEAYIAEAIRSVLNQTCNDWELIIVDDGSEDRSFQIANSFSINDQRIKVLRTESNQGPSATRNMAVESASGVWLAILDSDDVFILNKLEKQRDFIKKCGSEDLVLVGTGGIIFGGESGLKHYYLYPSGSRKLKSNLRAHKKFPFHSSIVYSARAFRQVGGFNDRYLRSQDYELWLRLAETGRFASIREPLVKYRLNKSGVSRNQSKEGFLPKTYSTAANVCLRLRHTNLADPSSNSEDFRNLLHLIQGSYEASMFEKLDGHQSILKSMFQSRNWGKFLIGLIRHPLNSMLVIAKRLGLISFERHIYRVIRHGSLGKRS